MLSKKTNKNITEEEQRVISVISFKPVLPIGSFMYKAFRYPGDIDLREKITICCDIDTAINKITEKIRWMAYYIHARNDIIFADFKAGVHNNEAIRWSLIELMRGTKRIGNEVLSLEDAINQFEVVKIDVIAYLNNRYVECSNFMQLAMLTRDGQEKSLVPEASYEDEIKGDIKKYMQYNTKDYNPFKALKRFLLLAIFYKDQNTYSKLIPLMSSGGSIASQIISDIKSVILIMEKYKYLPYNVKRNIGIMIDNIRSRISNIYEFDIDSNIIYDLVMQFKMVKTKGEKMEILNYLIKYIKEPLNYFAELFIKNNYLNLYIYG